MRSPKARRDDPPARVGSASAGGCPPTGDAPARVTNGTGGPALESPGTVRSLRIHASRMCPPQRTARRTPPVHALFLRARTLRSGDSSTRDPQPSADLTRGRTRRAHRSWDVERAARIDRLRIDISFE